ncbi:MAG: hypothetical protein F6K10_29490, partial [Moorea sp. SIO2B7]|nr:hypothetical protein [Moorena sp. SIO2B7]
MKPKLKYNQLLILILFYLIASSIGCWQILFIDGWPHNHEYLSFFERVEIFRIAMNSGDFFPLWTPFAAHGYGSPFPFFYHRLYSTIVALIALIINSTYLAVKISVPLLLTFGAVGMYKTAQLMKLKMPYCIATGLLLIFANYTLTDWLVRGAMAELSAAMLIPWLFYYCLNIIQGKAAGFKLGLIMACLFFAHSVIFYYSIIVFVITFILAFLQQKYSQKTRSYIRSVHPFQCHQHSKFGTSMDIRYSRFTGNVIQCNDL